MGSGLCGSGWVSSACRRRALERGLALARAVGIGCMAGALTFPAVAAAAPRALDLDWQAPSGCPDRNAIRRYVEEMLGNAEPATSLLSARGGVLRVAVDRWSADLTLRGASGTESTRTFEGPTCESVSRAAALVMALTIHPNEAPAASPANPPERETPAPARPIAGRFVHPEVAGTGVLDLGTTPGAAYGGALAVGWSPVGPWRLEAFVAYFAKRTGSLADQPNLGADLQLTAFGLRGCYAAVDVVVSFGPCVGGGFDWVRAYGFGARLPRDDSAFTGNVEVGAVILWNFTEFAAARLGAQAVFPLTRPEFIIEGAGTIYRRAPVGFRGTAGVELHF
jgi:hypothetical protein